MASSFGRWCKVGLLGGMILLGGAGCGDAFTATGGSGGTTSSSSGASGGGTGGTTTSSMECSPGEKAACYTGPAETQHVGACLDGKHICDSSGKWGNCDGEIVPVAEKCGDLVDSDCDGDPDNGCPCVGTETKECYGGPDGTKGVGTCTAGQKTCMNGAWSACVGQVTPKLEACSDVGEDNDCDGNKIDVYSDTLSADLDVGSYCDTGDPGVCAAGKAQCSGSEPTCVPDTLPGVEICDNKDNDCDGAIDNVLGVGDWCQAVVQVITCDGALKCAANQPGLVCAPYALHGGFDFGSDSGWSIGKEWQIGPAVASDGNTAGNGDPEVDHTPTADNGIAGIVIGGNASNEVHEPFYLTSPSMSLDQETTIYLTFWRFLNVSNAHAKATVEVSTDDGASWTTIWAPPVSGTIYDGAWTRQSLDISDYRSPTFRLRFGWQVLNSNGPIVSSWNIDDITIGTCPAPG